MLIIVKPFYIFSCLYNNIENIGFIDFFIFIHCADNINLTLTGKHNLLI